MKEFLRMMLQPESEDEESLRNGVIIVTALIVAILIYAILFPLSTLDEATQEIIGKYPECIGEIEVQEREWVGYGSTGINYYAVCEKVGVSIQIRSPK